MSKSSTIRLNLGCGKDHRRGYINIDVDPRVQPDLIHDLSKPLPYGDSRVSEILLQDVLEHFTKEDGFSLLQECARVLTPEGKITIRVPHVLNILQQFRKSDDVMMLFLYGDTTQNGVWGAHKYGYTPQIMEDTLLQLGIGLESIAVQDTNFHFVGKKLASTPQFQVKQSATLLSSNDVKLLRQRLSPKTYVLYCSLFEMIVLTCISRVKKQPVIWLFSSSPSTFIGKTVLRMLSTSVEWVVVEDSSTLPFVYHMLQFSHLRTIDLSKN